MTQRWAVFVVAALTLGVVHSAPAELPTPAECAAGDQAPLTLGDEPSELAVCIAAEGHTVVYVGGNAIGPCGAIIVADQTFAPHDDPNRCPSTSDSLPGSTWHEEYFPSHDGTELHADVYRPENIAESVPTPVLLVATPYNNTGGTGDPGTPPDVRPTGTHAVTNGYNVSQAIVPQIFERGYTVVAVGLRAMGASAGCDDFGGLKAQGDVKAAVEWVASRTWSTGRVGMWGLSAQGWTQIMALATKPLGLAALIVEAPPINRYAQSYMNGVPYALAAPANAVRYGYIDMMPPSIFSEQHQFENWAAGGAESVGGCTERNIVQSASDDPSDPFWIERDLTARASGSDIPVLLSQGFLDSNVKPGAFLPVWESLTGPHRAWLGQYEHVSAESPDHPYAVPGVIGHGGFRDEALRWLDKYVKQVPTDITGDPPVVVERSDGRWRIESQWPPADVSESSVTLRAGTYLDVHGNSAEAADPVTECQRSSVDGASSCSRTLNGIGAWTFTPPLPSAKHIAGAPSVEVHVETLLAKTNLIALVYDVDEDLNATLLDRGASLVRAAGNQTIRFNLYPQDWLVEAGHRIGVLLTGSDDGWFNPISTFTQVTVLGGALTLPELPAPRAGDLTGTLSLAGQMRAPFKLDPATVQANTSA
jgi:uncharacterized protein